MRRRPPGCYAKSMDEPDGYATHGDVKLAYWDRGQGPRTVLLIMGVFHRAAFWRQRVIDALAREFRVILFDNRGTGYSTKPAEEITAELWAGDALAVLDEVGVERCTIVGYSMGGRVLQQLMLDHPERVERAILLSAVVGGELGVPPLQEALASFVPDPSLDSRGQYRAGFVGMSAPGFVDRNPGALAEFLELSVSKRTPIKTLMNQFSVVQSGVCDQLTHLDIPVLIIQGDADPLVRPGNADVLARHLPAASRVDLPGIGHMVTWEAPDEFLEAALPFLRA